MSRDTFLGNIPFKCQNVVGQNPSPDFSH